MMDKKLKEIMFREFWEDDFNKALLVCTIGFTILSSVFTWTLPVIMGLWVFVLFRIPRFRQEYPNKFLLLIFLCVPIVLYRSNNEFNLAIIVLLAGLFVPEDKWDFLAKKAK